MTTTVRHAARGLVMTPQSEILLLKVDLPWIPGGAWTVPGGGIEENELVRDCVVRELFEETGLEDAEVSCELWRCEFRFEFQQKTHHIKERYFLVENEKFEPTTAHMIDYELEWMMGFKWWSANQLLESDENFIPKQLGTLMLKLTNNELHQSPFDVIDPLPST